jgi:hypothetical protein
MDVLPLLLSLTVGATLEVDGSFRLLLDTSVSLVQYNMSLHHSSFSPLPCGSSITLHVWEVL